jgi:PhoD-like phosphatase
MRPRRGVNRINLGPIVGHTDHQSTRIWIQVLDDPGFYQLRVQGVGIFDFVSTEGVALEFRTATAVAAGLRPDWRYRYNVLRLGRIIANGKGSFRTMPDPGSMAHLTFCAISCNKAESEGAWKALGKFVEDAQPQFILMMGDQLYLDEDGLDVFSTHKNSKPSVRRKAIAEKYHVNWSREPIRKVLANVPIYMLWDDHDLRDGWGSSASDSPTLVAEHTRGTAIFEKCRAYYEDCRDVYWHFQGCHNPRPSDGVDPALPNYIEGPPFIERRAMPYAFRCGRLVVLMLDSRGERDVFREELPILGLEQWQFVKHVFANLPADVEALAVITPTPIASLDPDGQVQKLMGNRTDDVDAFKKGDEQNALSPESSGASGLPLAFVNKHLSVLANTELNLGNFKIGNIDEARDQWSHKYSRPEQDALLRGAGKARLNNRTAGSPRGLIFISGDIHVGARFNVTCSDPSYEALSLTSSGISVVFGDQPIVHALLSEDFDIARGIHSSLQEVVTEFNFGIVQVIPTGRGAEIQGVVAHEGNSFALGVDFGLYL